MILSVCEVPEVLKVMRIVNIVIQIIRIAVPIILIVSAMIDLVRAVSNSELNKITKPMVAKVVAAVLIFLIPTFVRVVANIAGNDGEYEKCLGNITKETIELAYEKQEEILVSKAEESVDLNDYNNGISYLLNINDKTKKEEFQKRLDEVYKKIEENRPKKPSGSTMSGTVDGETGSYTFDGDGTQNEVIKTLNGEYIIAKTKADLPSYVSYIASKKLYQASDSKYNDKCLGFSEMHSWGYYTNRRNYNADNGGNYTSGGSFTKFIDEDMTTIMNVIYNEILNGRPVVLQVNGNKAGTSRHFVTVVGFKSSVTSGNSLKQEDLLIIDSYDGKLERMDTEKSRFMTSGADCHKDYKGYYLLLIKHAAAATNNNSNNNSGGGSKDSNTGIPNEHQSSTPGTYGCAKDSKDDAWYNCFSKSHNLVVPSLGAQGSTITMKVGETKTFRVNLPSECGTLVKYTRQSADGATGWSTYVAQSRTGVDNTGFTWVVKAKKAGSTIVSQTIQYDATSPSGKCTKNVKSMYRFNIKITN